jgi:ADP-heptose:LPS heptosyltransferase
MSKKQSYKYPAPSNIPKVKKIKSTITTIYQYAFFKALETIQLSNFFNNVIIIKGETVLLPISIYTPKSFAFVSTIETTFNKLMINTNLNNKKLLIIRYGGIGDVLSLLFAISELKLKFTNLQIGVLTSFKNLDILKNFPNLIDYISDPIIKLSALTKFDYISYLDNTIEIDLGSKSISMQDIYANHMFVNLTDNTLIDIFKHNIEINNKITPNGIGIHYKSNAIIRNYNIESVLELIKLLQFKFPKEPIYLLGSPNDYINSEYILSKNKNKIIVNGCGFKELNINETAKIINNLKLIIGVDSSMLHIAGVYNTPIIGLFGPFPSNLRIKYYNRSIGIDGLASCSPCFRHNPQEFCKINYGQGMCLNSISPQLIIDNIPENLI